MAGESYNKIPVGRIVVRGTPLISAEKTLTEVAKSGMLVTLDGNDYKVKKAAASTNPVGWVGYEDTDNKIRPSDYDTAYRIGDTVAVLSGGQFELVALATAGSAAALNITAGDPLASNNDGTLKAAGADDVAVAIACESVSIAASTVARVHVKTLI